MNLINYQDSRPIYEQITERYKLLILKGALAPDEQMPEATAAITAEPTAEPKTSAKATATSAVKETPAPTEQPTAEPASEPTPEPTRNNDDIVTPEL